MKPAYPMIALTLAGIAVLYGTSAAQSERAFENVSVLRLIAANGELRVKLGAANDGSGLLLANSATEPGVHVLAKGRSATLKLKAGESERVLEP